MEFSGGTFIYQIKGLDIYDTMMKWIKQLDLKQIEVKNTAIDDIIDEIRLIEKRPIPIEDVVNVWRIAFEMDSKYAVIHIIRTEH